MKTNEVKCAKCGKIEIVSTKEAQEFQGCVSLEEAHLKMLREGTASVLICDECLEDIKAFRKTLKN